MHKQVEEISVDELDRLLRKRKGPGFGVWGLGFGVWGLGFGLNYCTITAGKSIQNIRMSNSKITNAGVKLSELNVQGIDLDLTGFATDIVSETYQSGDGWFTITHDFMASPLNSGSSLFYNLIPNGARITSIQAIGNSLTGGGGATLAFGLETDAPNLIAADTLANVNSGKTYSGFSAAATANRSLAITAGVANVTGGSVTVRIELIV